MLKESFKDYVFLILFIKNNRWLILIIINYESFIKIMFNIKVINNKLLLYFKFLDLFKFSKNYF